MFEPRSRSSSDPPPRVFHVGLDLAKLNDFTAVAVIEEGRRGYMVRHLQRWRGLPYPQVVDKIESLLQSRVLKEARTQLVVDATGVGLPVVDMIRDRGLRPIAAVTITSGAEVRSSEDKLSWHVPRNDLFSLLVVLLQSSRLKVGQISGAAALAQELQNLRVRPGTKADQIDTWRESIHDDLVFAVALACWWPEQRFKNTRALFAFGKAIR